MANVCLRYVMHTVSFWCSVRYIKFTLEQTIKAYRGVEVSLYFFFNLGFRWGGWATPRPGRFTPKKETRYLLYRRLGGSLGRSGRSRKISLTPGFDPQTVHPVASRYIDRAIPVHRTLVKPKITYAKMGPN
jgi:hypothetical protein